MISRRTLFAILSAASGVALLDDLHAKAAPSDPLSPIPVSAPFLSASRQGNDIEDIQHWVRTVDKFASMLLRSRPAGVNAVYSPWSVVTASALLRLFTAGNSAHELDELLDLGWFPGWKTGISSLISGLNRYDHTPDPTQARTGHSYDSFVEFNKPIFHQASSAFIDKTLPIHQGALEQAHQVLDAVNYRVDFHNHDAWPAINKWVTEQTHGMLSLPIDHSPDAALPKTAAALFTTAYFSGQWERSFQPEGKKPFTTANGSIRQVDFMHAEAANAISNWQYQAIRIPYLLSHFAMDIILPPQGNSVDTILDPHIRSDASRALSTTLPGNRIIDIHMPSWKVHTHCDLKRWFTGAGVSSIFSAQNANFSPLSIMRLHIDKATHSSAIEVTKDGTTAAAVTESDIKLQSAPWPKSIIETIWVNRPFAYHIVDTRTLLPLFSGIIAKP